MSFNFSDPRQVLAGTVYGEARGCGRVGMENVAQVVLNRVKAGWNSGGITGVCLAYEQFSCWNRSDPNRPQIIDATAQEPPQAAWQLALDIADVALDGNNPDRVCGADSYFAHDIPQPPYWAHSPAQRVYSDGWHDFWRVKPARGAASPEPPETSDDLNAAELSRLGETGEA